MTQVLRQSTQIIVRLGPAVAVGDGFTPVTSLTLAGADEAELLKANTTTTTDISGATMAAITGCDGWYGLTLTTSLTDTVGCLDVMINDDSLILPIFARFQVIEEAAYDAIYAASADPKADINVSSIDAGAGVPAAGVADSGSTTTMVDTARTESATDYWKGMMIHFASGASAGQSRLITAFDPAADRITFTPAVTSSIATNDVYEIRQWTGVDLHQILGITQSVTDLKDFADDGYDPSTNKVQGVVLTDTVTTYTGNTPQTGDSFARLGAPVGASVSADIADIEGKVDDLETRLGTPSNLGSGATVSANLVDIEGQTDNLPTIESKIDTIDGIVNAILVDTAEIGAAGAGLTNINLPNQTMDIIGNITGNLSGSVGSVTGLTASNLDATISSRSSQASVDTIDGIVDSILVDTTEIGVAGAGLTNINLPNQTMDITGSLSGSVGSVTATVDANVVQVNAINVDGSGTTLDPWGPA